MSEFLSPEWIDALDAVVRSSPELADAADAAVVLEQRVIADDGETVYHLVLGPGPARIQRGPALAPDLTMVATADAARRIHASEANAQTCLADGSLRLRGNPEVLARRSTVLGRLGSLLATAVSEAGSPARTATGDEGG